MCRSVPQIALEVTRTTTSLGSSTTASETSSTTTDRVSANTTAFMASVLSLLAAMTTADDHIDGGAGGTHA
jgi:hypothetical protein